MEGKELTVRINSLEGEVELSGPEEMLERWWPRVRVFLRKGRVKPQVKADVELENDERSTGGDELPVVQNSTAVFGEFLLEFPNELSDPDRILIAGQFVQASDSEKGFSTRQATELLREQGFNLSNPSESVRRNNLAKRVFKIGKRKFRVSVAGTEYL